MLFRSRLSDITTTPGDPPQFRALERERFNLSRNMNYPAGLAELQKKAYPELSPLRSDLPAAQVFELVQSAVLEMRRWEIAAVETGRLQIEVIVASRIPLLKEDVVIQVRPDVTARTDGSLGSSVHMRCKARMGQGLTGRQAKRIRSFFKKLQAMLS